MMNPILPMIKEKTTMDQAIKTMRDRHHDYRRMMDVRAEDIQDNGDLILKGTPIIFDKEYFLFRYGDKEVYEIIRRSAFDHADYADVPVKYNHGDSKGTPARTTARTERGKLTINVLDDRVDVEMNLLPTTGGKDLYEEVKAGTVSQMSWAFTQNRETEETIEQGNKITFVVNDVERVFDISAVDFGANSATSIYARRLGELDERAEKLDERHRRALIAKIQILTKGE